MVPVLVIFVGNWYRYFFKTSVTEPYKFYAVLAQEKLSKFLKRLKVEISVKLVLFHILAKKILKYD
jgi:hypothetical protein